MTTTTDTTDQRDWLNRLSDERAAGWYAYGALTAILGGIDVAPRDLIETTLRTVVAHMETDYGMTDGAA